MLEVVLAAMASSGIDERMVVLGGNAEGVLAAVDLHGARPVVACAGRTGRRHRCAAGWPRWPGSTPALVVLGDGPWLDPRAVARMAAPIRGSRAARVAADYGAGRSHPVLHPARAVARPAGRRARRRDAGSPTRLVDCRRPHRIRATSTTRLSRGSCKPHAVDQVGGHRVAAADGLARCRAAAPRSGSDRGSSGTPPGAPRSCRPRRASATGRDRPASWSSTPLHGRSTVTSFSSRDAARPAPASRRRRPRCSRDITVPIGHVQDLGRVLVVKSPTSTRTTTSRKFSGARRPAHRGSPRRTSRFSTTSCGCAVRRRASWSYRKYSLCVVQRLDRGPAALPAGLVEVDVAQDRRQPRGQVRARPVAAQDAQRAQVGLLHQLLGRSADEPDRRSAIR